MNCPMCKSGMKEYKLSIERKKDKKTIHFLDCPVLLCEECGEVLIDDYIVAKMNEILDNELKICVVYFPKIF